MITIPEGVTVTVEGNRVNAAGPKGKVEKTFSPNASIKVDGNKVEVAAGKALKGTVESVIEGMMAGAKDGYVKKLKVLYAHFPISIEVKGKVVTIKNFLGEREPRRTAVVGDTKVEVKGQNVTISGPDKEAVGQTAANMKNSLRIKDKDPRIFQDGIFYAGD
jgi:large subunit ribosomal protein L6